MAISTTDRDAFIRVLFDAFAEDYTGMGRLLAKLELGFPAVAWRSRLVILARTYQPFLDSGLSIDWYTNEVGRLADAYKG